MRTFLYNSLHMPTREAFEKFMQETQTKINQLDEEMKKQTYDTLKAVYDNYEKMLLNRIASELALVDEYRVQGNTFEQNRHFQLAEIFKSILDNHVLYGPITNNVQLEIIANGDVNNSNINNDSNNVTSGKV